jgi:hypothetical protein
MPAADGGRALGSSVRVISHGSAAGAKNRFARTRRARCRDTRNLFAVPGGEKGFSVFSFRWRRISSM